MTTQFNTITGKRAIYYHTSWSNYARNFQVKDIPEDVMDISYAFWDVKSDGSIVTLDSWADTDKRYISSGVEPLDNWNDTKSTFFGNFGQFKKLLESGRRLNITLSLGGWTNSKYFSDMVSKEVSRTNFVNNLIDIFKKYPIFNGVSIDWEYLSDDGINYGNTGNIVSKDDSKNFILLLKQLKTELKLHNMGHYTIAMCCTAAPEKCKFNVEQIHPLIDQLHVMTYDFCDGNWGDKIAAFHTNPRKSSFGKWSCEEAADYYLSRGVPSTKIYIGAAFYSRGFSNTDGPGKSASRGSPDMSWENGIVDYKDLPQIGATEFIDKESKSCYSYDPIKKVLNSYDNKDSIIEKCKIAYEKNLGGIIIWENSGDVKNYKDSRCLTRALKDNLTHGYPEFKSTIKPPIVNQPTIINPLPSIPVSVGPPVSVVPPVPVVPPVSVVPAVVPVIQPVVSSIPAIVNIKPEPEIPILTQIPISLNNFCNCCEKCICKNLNGLKITLDVDVTNKKVVNNKVEYK